MKKFILDHYLNTSNKLEIIVPNVPILNNVSRFICGRKVSSMGESITNKYDMLHYKNGAQWIRLPEWTEFLIAVGQEVSTLSLMNDRKPYFGVVLPTQSYAAAFVALGVLNATTNVRRKKTTEEHFDTLIRLAKGSSVRVLEGDGYRKGKIIGFEVNEESKRLQVAITRSKGVRERRWYTPSECEKIQPSIEDNRDGIARGRTHRLIQNILFTSALLGDDSLEAFGMVSSSDCLAITHPARFRREVTEQFLGVHNADGFCEGCLQDLLRVKQFMQGGHTYHMSVMSPNPRDKEESTSLISPLVAVFDGITGILRWRHRFSSSGWILLIDKFGPNSDEAATILSQAYMNRSGDIMPSWKIVPKGIEVISFWR